MPSRRVVSGGGLGPSGKSGFGSGPGGRWKLGLFVVGGMAIGVFGLLFLGARELRQATRTAYAYFDEALTGLEKGSSVKFRGVTVGVVERIRFASDKKHLEVQAALFDDTLNDLGLSAENLESEDGLLQRLRAQVVMSWVTSTA
ncbi:MAG: MlaD family protein, partial [Planctomycetota bacterium]